MDYPRSQGVWISEVLLYVVYWYTSDVVYESEITCVLFANSVCLKYMYILHSSTIIQYDSYCIVGTTRE